MSAVIFAQDHVSVFHLSLLFVRKLEQNWFVYGCTHGIFMYVALDSNLNFEIVSLNKRGNATHRIQLRLNMII